MRNGKTIKPVLSALFAALIAVSTMIIRIPLPGTGYAHLGDAVVLLAAFSLGGVYGAAAAGIGSCLADIFSGFAYYAPATVVIKVVMVLITCVLFSLLVKKSKKHISLKRILASSAGGAIMVLGYFLYETVIYGVGVAILAVPGNIVQAVTGIVISSVLVIIFLRNPAIKERLWITDAERDNTNGHV